MLSFAYTHATQCQALHLKGKKKKNKEERPINPKDNSSPQSDACMLCLITSNDKVSHTAFEKAMSHGQSSHFSSLQFHPTTPNCKLLVPT